MLRSCYGLSPPSFAGREQHEVDRPTDAEQPAGAVRTRVSWGRGRSPDLGRFRMSPAMICSFSRVPGQPWTRVGNGQHGTVAVWE